MPSLVEIGQVVVLEKKIFNFHEYVFDKCISPLLSPLEKLKLNTIPSLHTRMFSNDIG